jgi:glyoxylase-like metal-dependent hydrolase (beta-lactamase superfamily II)
MFALPRVLIHPAAMSLLDRRAFLRGAATCAAAGLLAPLLSRAESGSAAPEKQRTPATPAAGGRFGDFRPLRRNVGLFTGRGGTIGYLASPEALVVVDTQFPDTAATCLAGLPGRAARTLDVVFNTHHHADHTSGNPVFRPLARALVAQANVPKLQFAAAQRAEQDPKAASGVRLENQVYADTTFDEAWRHELPDEVIAAQYFGPAHTSGDAALLFEKANVVHLGDLVFNRLYPIIDRSAGGSVRHWIAVLEEAAKTYPADAIFLFGHGNAKFGVSGARADLLVMRDFWSAVLSHAQKAVEAGKPRADAIALTALRGFADFEGPPARLSACLAAAYDELTDSRRPTS